MKQDEKDAHIKEYERISRLYEESRQEFEIERSVILEETIGEAEAEVSKPKLRTIQEIWDLALKVSLNE